jgi:hypothetical protein
MIFSRTIRQVLDGSKTQTRRLCYAGDSLGYATTKVDGVTAKRKAVFENLAGRPRPRWIVGHTYAVQPERCHSAKGRILLLDLRREDDPTLISDEDARSEGFADLAAFLTSWNDLHRKQPRQPVWVLTFKLVLSAVRRSA